MPGLLHVTKRPNGSTRGYFSYAVRSVDYLETVRRRRFAYTNVPRTGPRSAGSTSGNLPRNRDRGPPADPQAQRLQAETHGRTDANTDVTI